jgi:hypothetical protein
MKQNLQSYHELIRTLEERFNDLHHAYGQRDALKADAEQNRSQRQEVLAGAVADTSEEAIDHLARHNAKQEVFAAKLTHLEGQIEQAEEELQHAFMVDFLPPFRTLYNDLLQHRFQRGKAQIAQPIVSERVILLNSLIEQLAKQTDEYVSGQALELFVTDGVSTPLHNTPSAPWGENPHREQTLQILLQTVEGALQKAKQLLAAVEAEKGFTSPELEVHAIDPVAEAEAALA